MKSNHVKMNNQAQKTIPMNNKLVSNVRKNMLQTTDTSQKKIKKDQNKNNESSLEKKTKINFKSKISNSKKNKNKKDINYTSINEDSSTNCISRNNIKNNITKKLENIENLNIKTEFDIPFILPSVTETESFFINPKLAENESYDVSPIKKTYKNIIRNKREESCEIYDFNNQTHVELVLNNFSKLSQSQGIKDNSSTCLEENNDEETSGNKKVINKIKIFNTKHSAQNLKIMP